MKYYFLFCYYCFHRTKRWKSCGKPTVVDWSDFGLCSLLMMLSRNRLKPMNSMKGEKEEIKYYGRIRYTLNQR